MSHYREEKVKWALEKLKKLIKKKDKQEKARKDIEDMKKNHGELINVYEESTSKSKTSIDQVILKALVKGTYSLL